MKMENKHFLFCFVLLISLARISESSASHPTSNSDQAHQTQSYYPEKAQKHIVLIHGACGGAWTWYKVTSLLRNAGHKVTPLDMAASGINPVQVQQLHSYTEYYQPLTDLITSLPRNERIILAAHSMNGAVISIFMEKYPEKIAAAVYVAAFMTGPTLKYSAIFQEINKRLKYMDTEYRFDNGAKSPASAFRFGPKVLATNFAQLTPPEDLALTSALIRFSPLFNYDVAKLTKKNYGSVKRVYVVCNQDLAIKLEVQKYMIKYNKPDEVRVINGTDHFVMLSKPMELFRHLHKIAEKYS